MQRRSARFMRMQRLVWLFVLAGCPASSSRYVVADVTAARAPLHGALVAANCGAPYSSAQRTDEDGRARLRVFTEGNTCALLVAKPGYPTVETGPVNICPAGACAPTRVDLAPIAAPPVPRRETARPSAQRPVEVAQ